MGDVMPTLYGRDGVNGIVPDGPGQCHDVDVSEIDAAIVDAGAQVLVDNGWARAYEAREIAFEVLAGALPVARKLWEAGNG